MTGSPPHVIAGCFALAAFAVAVVAGVAGGNPASVVLGRALLAMTLCYPMGLMIGALCHRVVQEHLEATDRAAKAVPHGAGDAGEVEVDNAQPSRKEDVIAV